MTSSATLTLGVLFGLVTTVFVARRNWDQAKNRAAALASRLRWWAAWSGQLAHRCAPVAMIMAIPAATIVLLWAVFSGNMNSGAASGITLGLLASVVALVMPPERND